MRIAWGCSRARLIGNHWTTGSSAGRQPRRQEQEAVAAAGACVVHVACRSDPHAFLSSGRLAHQRLPFSLHEAKGEPAFAPCSAKSTADGRSLTRPGSPDGISYPVLLLAPSTRARDNSTARNGRESLGQQRIGHYPNTPIEWGSSSRNRSRAVVAVDGHRWKPGCARPDLESTKRTSI